MSSDKCKKCDKDEAKFRCGSCKKITYCSKECQLVDWGSHKEDCTYVPKQLNEVNVVVVDGYDTRQEKMPLTELEMDKGWDICEIPKMIGVPLMVKRLRDYEIRPSFEKAIFMMADPKTGLAAPKWQDGVGVVAFAKTDKTDLSIHLFWQLSSYIYELMDFYTEADFSYELYEKKHLNEDAFIDYMESEHD